MSERPERKESTTEMVLQFIRNRKHQPAHHPTHAPEEHEEHEEHIDERWLVSYADMMTLLFGLFVMLYSISSIDAVKLARVRSATQKEFGGSASVETKLDNFTPAQKEEERERLAKELEQARKALEEATLKVVQTNEALTKAQQDLTQIQTQRQQLETDVANLKTEREALKAETQKNQVKVENIKDTKTALKKVQTEKETVVRMLASAQSEKATLQKQISDLQTKVAQLGPSQATSFLAVIILWSSANHDIDLEIEDPRGKKFDFKHRTHGGYPGRFSLDTRRGPGAELWQTDELVPGIYKVSYVFYNQYGNKEPCTVSGTVYSSKGGRELPTTTLSFEKSNRAVLKVKVEADGSTQVL